MYPHLHILWLRIMTTTIAIIGHNGNVGKKVLPHLIKAHEAGQIKLVVLHRPSSAIDSILSTVEKRIMNGTDSKSLKDVVKGVNILLYVMLSSPNPCPTDYQICYWPRGFQPSGELARRPCWLPRYRHLYSRFLRSGMDRRDPPETNRPSLPRALRSTFRQGKEAWYWLHSGPSWIVPRVHLHGWVSRFHIARSLD